MPVNTYIIKQINNYYIAYQLRYTDFTPNLMINVFVFTKDDRNRLIISREIKIILVR